MFTGDREVKSKIKQRMAAGSIFTRMFALNNIFRSKDISCNYKVRVYN